MNTPLKKINIGLPSRTPLKTPKIPTIQTPIAGKYVWRQKTPEKNTEYITPMKTPMRISQVPKTPISITKTPR